MVAVLAHRGASKAVQENTIGAFRLAGAMGSDAVELDVRRTSDGVLVVHHDAFLVQGEAIVGLRADELPTHVPRLDAALDSCEGMWVNVEIKNAPDEPDFDPTDSIADHVVAALVERDDDERWLISSFRIETIDRCRALRETIRTAWLVSEVPHDVIATMVSRGHVALHPCVASLNQSHIDVCHGAGIDVNTWTCDDPRRMGELIDWGVDGICTNVPDVAIEVIARHRGGQAADG